MAHLPVTAHIPVTTYLSYQFQYAGYDTARPLISDPCNIPRVRGSNLKTLQHTRVLWPVIRESNITKLIDFPASIDVPK